MKSDWLLVKEKSNSLQKSSFESGKHTRKNFDLHVFSSKVAIASSPTQHPEQTPVHHEAVSHSLNGWAQYLLEASLKKDKQRLRFLDITLGPGATCVRHKPLWSSRLKTMKQAHKRRDFELQKSHVRRE